MKAALRSLYRTIPLKQPLFAALRRLNPPASIYRHLHFRGVFSVEIPDTHQRFRMSHFGYELENELFWRGLYGGYESESLRTWVKLCRRARSIVDVGANTGLFSLVAKTVNPAASVTAFEPVERVYRKLIDNIRLNHLDIDAVPAALSNHTGEGHYFDTLTEHVYSITVNKNLLGADVPFEKRPVHMIALDDFIRENRIDRIDLMKIDVETHEAEVLEGLHDHLDRFRPDILVEVLDDEVAAKLNHVLAGKDYRFFDISERDGLHPIEDIRKSTERNILVCSPETAAVLGF